MNNTPVLDANSTAKPARRPGPDANHSVSCTTFRIAYFAHSVRSDWNNGNAHFQRGLLRAMTRLGHKVVLFEPEDSWSRSNLEGETLGERSIQQFNRSYSELRIESYQPKNENLRAYLRRVLDRIQVAIVHEWNPPELAHELLALRSEMGFALLFHDTHHRAFSAPDQIRKFNLEAFDGAIVFGESLRSVYRRDFRVRRVWTLHEAADTDIFHPCGELQKTDDVVWIGNWGDEERSEEIRRLLLEPATALPNRRFTVYGVRYPRAGLAALERAHVRYGGYLPNLDAPGIYARAKLTVHIPRRQYTNAAVGVPTIRVFEALACGIPLICAPWRDSEHLFRAGDFLAVRSTGEMTAAMRKLLEDPAEARAQAQRGLETVLARHTCRHRARELTSICGELIS